MTQQCCRCTCLLTMLMSFSLRHPLSIRSGLTLCLLTILACSRGAKPGRSTRDKDVNPKHARLQAAAASSAAALTGSSGVGSSSVHESPEEEASNCECGEHSALNCVPVISQPGSMHANAPVASGTESCGTMVFCECSDVNFDLALVVGGLQALSRILGYSLQFQTFNNCGWFCMYCSGFVLFNVGAPVRGAVGECCMHSMQRDTLHYG